MPRLFDWDAWGIDHASDDLAYLMAVHWYPDQRRAFEHRLLDRYHEELLAHAVTGYSRTTLQEDYRVSVLWQIARAIWQRSIGIPPVIWWNNLEGSISPSTTSIAARCSISTPRLSLLGSQRCAGQWE